MKKTRNKLKDADSQPKKFGRLFFTLFVAFALLTVCFFVFKWTGLWNKINSIDKLKKIVESGGVYSALIFVALQVLQTTVLQIPAFILTIAGALVFGPIKAFLLSYLAVMIGSIIMFWVGRKAGRKFLHWLVGKESAENWIEKMSHGKYLFFLMMLFPCFPDDILCVVAGVTDMSFPFFFWTNILARGMGIASVVFFGSGKVIPFHGWGLFVWGIIVVVVATLFYLSIKYKDKIDEIFSNLSKKKVKSGKK